MPSWLALTFDGEAAAFDLLVVLELELEQPHHLDGRTCGAGDADHRMRVGGEHLFHVAMRDEVARGGSAVAGHEHTVAVAQRDDGGAVGDLGEGPPVGTSGKSPTRWSKRTKLGPGSSPGGNNGTFTSAEAIGYWPPFWM